MQYNLSYLDYLAERTGGKVFSPGKAATDIRPFLDEFRRLLALQFVIEYPTDKTIKKVKVLRKVRGAKVLAPKR